MVFWCLSTSHDVPFSSPRPGSIVAPGMRDATATRTGNTNVIAMATRHATRMGTRIWARACVMPPWCTMSFFKLIGRMVACRLHRLCPMVGETAASVIRHLYWSCRRGDLAQEVKPSSHAGKWQGVELESGGFYIQLSLVSKSNLRINSCLDT